MAGAHVEFTGDASGAAAAAAQAQAAIDAVHGKTVTVEINVRRAGSGDLNAAAGQLDRVAGAGRRAAAASREHERASGRAAGSARDHAAATERAGAAMGRAGDRYRQTSRDADRAGGSVRGLGRDSDRAGRSAGAAGRAAGRLGDALTDLGLGASRTANSLAGAVGNAHSIGNVMGAGASAVQAFGVAAAYSAAGSAVLTGAVGALGAVGVGALGGVGVAAGAAGGAMAAFALDAHKDSARFGNTLKQMGGQAHLAAQAISEPMTEALVGLGRSLVGADNVMKPAGAAIVGSLQAGFGNAAGVITANSDSIVEAAVVAAGGFARLTGEAAPGVSAFLGSMPSLAAGAVSGMSQITSEFGRSAGAIAGSTPAINRMVGSLGGLGAELVRTGAGSIVPFSENVASMARGLTTMTSDLAPAIKPSMQAVTDTVNAASGGLGSLAPDIAGFARTLSANAPQMESIVGSLGQGMLAFGGAAVQGLGMAAPSIAGMADSIQANQGGIASVVGGLVGGAADVIGFAADVVGTGAKIDSAVKSVLPPGGGYEALTGRPSTASGGGQGLGGAPSPGVALGDQVRKSLGLGPSGMGARNPFAKGEFFSPGGTFDQVSASPGGLLGTVGRALPANGLLGIMGRSFGAPAGAPATGGAPIPQQLSGLFTGATQTAQQGAAGIPAAMASAMQQSRQAIGGANLGGAMRAPMAAVQGAVQGSGVAPAVGAQMNQATRVVQNSTGAAASAGSKVGAAIGGGMAKGTTSSTTVTDEIIINRITKMKENAMGAMRAKSPSRDFEDIAGYAPQGFDIGLIKGFRQPPPRAISAGIAERGREAMAASSRSFAQQRAQGDADRAMMQSLRISTPAARVAAQGGQMPAEGLKGAAKREAFGEGAGYKGSRMVFDKQVMSWQAKPGVEMATDRAFSNDMVQSPLSAAQQTAMESMQGALDRGRGGSFGMKGERTQQNILRNRAGALEVARVIADEESRANQQQRGAGTPSGYNPFSIGGSGGGGQSYLGRNRIAMVRDAAGLGGQVAAGYGQGLNANRAAAVGPMGQMAAAQKKRYTDDWGIRSPSTVAAGYSADIMAGSAAGLVGNASGPVGAIGAVSDSMQVVAGDRGLQVGYTWSRNVLTGADQILKKADYQAAGLPRLDSAAAMTALAGTGLLKAGSGASIVKTVGNTPSVVTLGGPSSGGQRSFTIRHELDINGQVHDIATEVFLDNFGRVQDAVAVAAR